MSMVDQASMAGADDFDDDYVARLLADDAKKTSQKYSAQGLSAFLPQRRAVDAPKPNTRFLSHIVREADSHNAALKKKEEVEAGKRLKRMRQDDENPRKRLRVDETNDSKRRRLANDIMSAAHSDASRRPQHKKQSHSHRGQHNMASVDREDAKRNRRRHVSGYREFGKATHGRHSRRHSSDSNCSDRSDEPRASKGSRRHERRRADADEATALPKKSTEPNDNGKICDVETTGPEERVRKRGRGAHKLTSGIETRFAKDYDPSQDISLDSGENHDSDDWDMALEAMRDRTKWRKNQASRMREAGFKEDEILKWERASNVDDSQRGPGDVKWSQKGETREWDAGKDR